MANSIRDLLTISRPEFLPANSASLVIGVSWGLTLPVRLLWGLGVPLLLAYAVITLVAAYAAQINTLSDYKLDQKDDGKTKLVNAMGHYSTRRLKLVMASELSLSLVLLALLAWLEQKPLMLAFWAAAVFLAYAYSSPPLRLKSRGFAAVLTLLAVLSILPVTFVAYSFTSNLTLPFWIFLAGQALTVYGVIVPAEIRDYFSDKQMGIVTMTVQLGLTRASLLGIGLLSLGGTLAALGISLGLIEAGVPLLSLFVVLMAVAYLSILAKYWKLLTLSHQYSHMEAQDKKGVEQAIVDIAAKNPKWITLITQILVVMCIVLLVAKLL